MSFESLNSRDITIKNILGTISKYEMFNPKDSVLISVSGGPDSVFLTSVLYSLRDHFKLKLYCFHLDHKTRNGQSKKDAEFVEKFCAQLGIELYKEEIDVKKWCTANKLSFQEGARILRKKSLERIAEKQKIKRIAVGHNADDNIETFFTNLIRGSGLRGLAAIKPKSGKFIRPLINTSRDEIIAGLDRNGISYCKDRTNLENIYFRNKIRNLLIPFIKQNFSKNFNKKLLQTIEIINEENDYINNLAKKTLKKIAVYGINPAEGNQINSIVVPIEKLQVYPDAFKKRIVIAAIKEIKGNLENIKRANINDIIKTCFLGGERKNLSFTGNIKFIKEADRIIFLYSVSEPVCMHQLKECEIIPGEMQEFREFGIRCFSEVINGNIESLKKELINESEAYIDFDKIKPPLKVRIWQKNKGEKFYPLGASGSKKIHDFFIDNKIPQSLRYKIPLFSDSEKIIWIGKYRVDDRVKVDLNTKRILHIKIFNI